MKASPLIAEARREPFPEGQFAEWGDEENFGFDVDTGAPKISDFSNALQLWSILQQRPCSVGEAARVFNVPPARIYEAIEHHYWMFLTQDAGRHSPDDVVIQHEGE